MPIYSVGKILKICREEKKITQEELCEGICTTSALSKIENGHREPTYVTFASLMERMGEWPEAYDIFIGDKVYRVNELQSRIRTSLYHQELQKAGDLLDELEQELKNFPNETVYHQFLELGRTICKADGKFDGKYIEKLENIISWTVPDFGKKPIGQCFLSHQELMLANNIAIGYGEIGEGEKAIGLLRELKEYLESNYMGNRNKATMYSTILLNLVKYLGLEGYYEEALGVAEKAIGILAETGKTLKIATLRYDIAWICTKLDQNKYQQRIEDELVLSLCTDISNQNYHSANETISLIEENMKDCLNGINLHHILALYHRMAPAHCPKQSD